MLESLKKQVVEIAIRADESGLCKHKSGNFSLKDPETGYIVITPSGVAREELTYKDIALVDGEGNIVELETKVKPTSELLMHLMAYKCRDDVYGVCHTHSHYATAFAVQAKEIQPVVFEALLYGTKTPIAKYGQPGTQDLADSIVEPFKISDACLLEKHGVLAVGASLEEAYLKAQYVEDVAEIYYYSLQIGEEPVPIAQSEFNAVAKRMGKR